MMAQSLETPPKEKEDRQIRELLRDLHQPSPRTYWADLAVTAAIGWFAFALAVAQQRFSLGMLVAVGVAVLALYRGLCFLHEISHLHSKALRGFETAWNVLFGFPLLMPSFVYTGVHQYHHKLSTYGTKSDPEYLPFASSAAMTGLFAAQSFLVPVLLIFRFLLLTPIGVCSPRFQHWLAVHASSLTMNVAYRRDLTPGLSNRIGQHGLILWLAWMSLAVATLAGIVPLRIWSMWLLVSSLTSFLNTLRTLGAHAYESSGQLMNREEQLADSIDTPGAFWTELWAPVGLRYHALHHYFPGIPYHNLAAAYRRLVLGLESGASYHQASSPGLPHSLTALVAKGIKTSR